MSLSGISLMTNNLSAVRLTESQATQDNNDNSSGGWKYLTIRKGGKVYTYIVIGKDMRILIGESVDKNEADKDPKTAEDKKAAANNSDQTNTIAQNVNHKLLDEQTSFLNDYRMLGLTAEYQKRMREIMKNMEDHIGYSKVSKTNATKKDKY